MPRPAAGQPRRSSPTAAFQGDVDPYRNRSLLAPSKAEAKKAVSQGRALRSLEGFIEQDTAPTTSSDPAASVVGLAAQGVKRTFPGHQTATMCKSVGKDEDIGPDSYEFRCITTLASGKRYVDAISCFDMPPYTNYDSCTEHDGYPKRPPRSLP